jgi:hypothetical protein
MLKSCLGAELKHAIMGLKINFDINKQLFCRSKRDYKHFEVGCVSESDVIRHQVKSENAIFGKCWCTKRFAERCCRSLSLIFLGMAFVSLIYFVSIIIGLESQVTTSTICLTYYRIM